jgi:hypothetical protein
MKVEPGFSSRIEEEDSKETGPMNTNISAILTT